MNIGSVRELETTGWDVFVNNKFKDNNDTLLSNPFDYMKTHLCNKCCILGNFNKGKTWLLN